jgi:hypothetical protein
MGLRADLLRVMSKEASDGLLYSPEPGDPRRVRRELSPFRYSSG